MRAPNQVVPEVRVGAVMVAAGESRRMGATNKLALDWQGQSMLRRCAEELVASDVSEVVAVVGYQSAWALSALRGLRLETVTNDDWSSGQMASVNTGLASLSPGLDAFMVCLADMPELTRSDINRLITGFAECQERPILVPYFGEQRGNPVLFASALLEPILAGPYPIGCRRFIDANPALVRRLETSCDRFVKDIDTPDDYRKLRSRFEN